MKTTKLKKLSRVLTILFLSLSFISFSQQNNDKKIEKLKKKYDYVSNISDQQTFLTGKSIKGPSDGGGGFTMGLNNIKIVNLEGKVIMEPELANYRILLPFGRNDVKYSNLFCLWGGNNKVGIINTNGKIILEPTYDHINGFNAKGQAIAFNGDVLQVIDSEGRQILKENYKYKVNYDSFFSIPTPGKINYFNVINNNLVCSKDGVNYGVINVLTNKTVIPFEYSAIDPELFIKDTDTIGYPVFKNKLVTIRDIKTNKELSPFVFEEITDVIKINNGSYLEGKNDNVVDNTRESLFNYFDLKNQKLVFPKGLKMSKAIPINNTFWIVNYYGDFLVYNVVKNEAIKTNDEIISISKLTDKAVLYENKSHASWVYDLEKNKKIMEFPKKPSVYSFSLKKDGRIKDFFTLTSSKEGNWMDFSTLYDNELNVIFSDLNYAASYVEEDKYIISEDINGKRVMTAYDFDGKIIGEKYKFTK